MHISMDLFLVIDFILNLCFFIEVSFVLYIDIWNDVCAIYIYIDLYHSKWQWRCE